MAELDPKVSEMRKQGSEYPTSHRIPSVFSASNENYPLTSSNSKPHLPPSNTKANYVLDTPACPPSVRREKTTYLPNSLLARKLKDLDLKYSEFSKDLELTPKKVSPNHSGSDDDSVASGLWIDGNKGKNVDLYGNANPTQDNITSSLNDMWNSKTSHSNFLSTSTLKEPTVIHKKVRSSTRASSSNTSELSDWETKGEELAGYIDWTRPTWVMGTVGVSGPILSAEEQREDFINLINNNTNGAGELELCNKCKIRHIIPGTSVTLGDRDTCLASLPEWFPRKEDENAWDTFTQLFNALVALEEMEKGFNHRNDPTRPKWDLHFHEKGDQWTTPHARQWGGWWKCRCSPDAPEVERRCHHCHKPNTPKYLKNPAKKGQPIAVERQLLLNYIEYFFKKQGSKDREAALATLRANGIPDHFGPAIDDKAKRRLIKERDLLRENRNRSESMMFKVDSFGNIGYTADIGCYTTDTESLDSPPANPYALTSNFL